MTTRTLALSSLTIDPTINVRQKTDPDTVEQYAEIFEKLPPITVFDGGLVADGFHRIEAARKRGSDSIKAEIHRGSRDAALVFAAEANTAHGRPLTQKERRTAAERLLTVGKLGVREVARRLGMSQGTVSEINSSLAVRQGVRIRTPGKDLSASHFDMISRAPEEHWQPLADAAVKRKWTAHETRAAAQVVKDERTPPQHRAEVLAGDADPFPLDEAGEPTVSADTVGKRVKESAKHGLTVPLHNLLTTASVLELRISEGEEIDSRMPLADRQQLAVDLDRLAGLIPRLKGMLVGDIRPAVVKGGRS